MADYTGVAQTLLDTDFPASGSMMNSLIQSGYMDTSKYYSGSQSLLLRAGSVHELFWAAEAGSKTINVRVWPASGTARMRLLSYPGRDVIDSDVSAGTGAWEQLSISETVTAQLYIISLENPNSPDGEDKRVWFDALEVV